MAKFMYKKTSSLYFIVMLRLCEDYSMMKNMSVFG